jgi:hypothetical protein
VLREEDSLAARSTYRALASLGLLVPQRCKNLRWCCSTTRGIVEICVEAYQLGSVLFGSDVLVRIVEVEPVPAHYLNDTLHVQRL